MLNQMKTANTYISDLVIGMKLKYFNECHEICQYEIWRKKCSLTVEIWLPRLRYGYAESGAFLRREC